jgi:hypothetical protein
MEVRHVIERNRFSLTDEKKTQAEMSDAFTAAGIEHVRECHLSDGDIVDFMLKEGVAIEVKLKGQRMAIYRQLERYAASDRVTAIVLATAISMQLPPTIGGKPASVVSLSRGWL